MKSVRSILSVNLLTAFTMIAGFASNILLASLFGLSLKVDAYFAAVVIPSVTSTLFVTYIGKTFLPIYSSLREKKSSDIDIFVSSVMNIAGIGALLIIAILLIFSKPILETILPGFDEETVNYAQNMLFLMSPSILFISLNNFHGYLWQYEGKYYRVVIENLLLPVCIMLSMLVWHEDLKELSIPLGYIIGRTLGFIILSIGTPYKYKPGINTSMPELRSLFQASSVLLSTGFIARMRQIVEKSVASTLGEGSISALAMGNKLCNPIHQGATIGIRMMAFSKASKLVAKGEVDAAGNLTNSIARVLLLIMTPVVVLLLFYSSEITAAVFLRGKFNADMHDLVTIALLGLAPTIIFMSINPILSNMLFSLETIKVQAWLGPIGTGIYLIAAVTMSQYYGLLGVALAMSVTTLAQFLILGFFTQRFVSVFDFNGLIVKLLVYVCLALSVLTAMAKTVAYFTLPVLLEIFLAGVLAGAIYLLLLFILKDKAIMFLWDTFT